MGESGFIHLKTIPIYSKTIVMLSAMSDDKIVAIVKSTTQYFVSGEMPVMDDPISQMLINEICECIDKAEENRVRKSEAGKKGMENRYNPNTVITQLQDTYNSDITQLQDSYNYTYTKTYTDNNTDKDNKKENKNDTVSLGIIDASSESSDAAAKKRQKFDDNIAYFIIKMYNSICVSLPEVKKVSQKRINSIKARLKLYSIDDFCTVFNKAEQSRFLKGGGDKDFVADFDWLTKDSSMAKVIDGKYDDDQNGNCQSKPLDSKFSQQMRVLEEYRQRFLAEERAESNDQI